jgi:hypothetical protein
VAELRRALEEKVTAWSRAWFPAGSVPAVEVACDTEHRPESVGAGLRWYALDEAGARLTVRIADASIERLGCAAAGVSAPDGLGLADGMGRRALAALMGALARMTPPARPGALDAAPAPEDVLARHGAVAMRVVIGHVKCTVHLNASLCARLVPATPTALPPLAGRRAAVGPTLAPFNAVLELGEIALADTLALQPGDVIRTQVPTDATLTLVSPGGQPLLTGQLAADGDYRALRISRVHFQTGPSR